MQYFNKAKACFEKAVRLEPRNEVYKKAFEMTAKAPALHAELQKQFAAQQMAIEARVNGARSRASGATQRERSGQGGGQLIDGTWWCGTSLL